MKNKLKFYLFFSGIIFSILGSFFIFQFSFSAEKIDILGGLSKSTPIEIQQNANFNDIISNVVGTALSFIAVIFFIIILYGGFMWMTASGNEDQAKKAKDIIIASAIGVIIIMSSYTLIKFIFNTIENKDTSTKELLNTCKEYNPNWDCMDIAKCAGRDGLADLTNATTECAKGNLNNCIIGKCMADGLDKEVNTICCLPYVSPCTLENPGYKCVDNANKCTSLPVGEVEDGLCDGVEVCCDSREVWTYYYHEMSTSWSIEEGKEGQIEKFACVSTIGSIKIGGPVEINTNFLLDGKNVWGSQWGSIIDNPTLNLGSLGKYQFNSEAECQEYGETEKVFCLKYDRTKGFYCSELLKGQSTKDCAETSSRLFGELVNGLDIPCLVAKDSRNN